MRLRKKKRNYKTTGITFKLKEREKNKIKQKAALYCEGNVSEWVLYAATNHVPNQNDIER